MELSNRDANGNDLLLDELVHHHDCISVGHIGGFKTVRANWRCPACYRTKENIARKDKNNNLCCQISWHHDHFGDWATDVLKDVKFETLIVLRESMERFPQQQICQDCNNADTAAKIIVVASEFFSFSPQEISTFINVTDNAPHTIRDGDARKAYEPARASAQWLAVRITAIKSGVATGGFNPLAASVGRVISELDRKINEAGDR